MRPLRFVTKQPINTYYLVIYERKLSAMHSSGNPQALNSLFNDTPLLVFAIEDILDSCPIESDLPLRINEQLNRFAKSKDSPWELLAVSLVAEALEGKSSKGIV